MCQATKKLLPFPATTTELFWMFYHCIVFYYFSRHKIFFQNNLRVFVSIETLCSQNQKLYKK